VCTGYPDDGGLAHWPATPASAPVVAATMLTWSVRRRKRATEADGRRSGREGMTSRSLPTSRQPWSHVVMADPHRAVGLLFHSTAAAASRAWPAASVGAGGGCTSHVAGVAPPRIAPPSAAVGLARVRMPSWMTSSRRRQQRFRGCGG
jgi:hypothetical protein